MAAAAARLPACGGQIFRALRSTVRTYTAQTDGEARVTQILKEKFPRAAAIKVVDISEEETSQSDL